MIKCKCVYKCQQNINCKHALEEVLENFNYKLSGRLTHSNYKNAKYTLYYDYIIWVVMNASKKCGHNNWVAAKDALIILKREGFPTVKNWTPYVNNIVQRFYRINAAIENKQKVTLMKPRS